MGDFLINSVSGWTTWKARLVDESYDNLLLPAPRKEAIETKSANANGKQVTCSDYFDERTVNLIFDLECSSFSDYKTKYAAFVTALNNKVILLTVSDLGLVYKLKADDFTNLVTGSGIRDGKLTVRFNEPNPTDRTTV